MSLFARSTIVVGGAMLVVTLATTIAEIHREIVDYSEWTRDLEDPDPDRRAGALDRYTLSMNAWPRPVPCVSLARRLGDDAVRERARGAVARVVGAGHCVNSVTTVLDSATSVPTRAVSARVLAFTPIVWHATVIPSLVTTTERADSSAIAAVVALGQLGDPADAARAAVARASMSERESMRVEAIEAMARIARPEEIAAVIQRALRDSSANVRAAAVNALAFRAVATQSKTERIGQLQPFLLDSSSSVRTAAKDALRALGAISRD